MTLQQDAIAETVTLQIPAPLYARAKQAVGKDNAALEQLLISALASGFSLLDDLPDDMVTDIAAFALLNDSALWRIARRTMAPDHYQRLDELLTQQKQRALEASQQQALDSYLAEYDTIVLQRAHAAVLLKQRGYDLSDPKILAHPTGTI